MCPPVRLASVATIPWKVALVHVFSTISIVALLVGFASAAIIVADMIAGHPQRMAIMNLVWPINAL